MSINFPETIKIRVDKTYDGFKVSDNRGCSGTGSTVESATYQYYKSIEQKDKYNAGYDIPFAGIDD